MILVMNTNVLVSGVLSPYGPPGQLLDMVLDGALTLVLSPLIAEEYREVLLRPHFQFDPQQIDVLLETLENTSLHVAPLPWPQPLPDPDDEPFIAAAAAAFAPLVTGNLADYPTDCRNGVNVYTPREFFDKLRSRGPQQIQEPSQNYQDAL
ncbi:putative toxin-antitoxin system toxin component, PIN family [Saccharophagus sp. K07]|uniref:putative toxin-antitoxin system toxin component, PIN family n=1 Tax=Saccharophagus sp. K07 TaxID=2283636 RepID=UPI0016522E1C|nr:putative toxin-antitoxin system toxin component, PIN family [Saccharophagus sp. K07]MBC6907366.1 putative toxin-antitoxin system toxin component, PIN family [Saccharophagus sp. K07]